MKLRLTLIMILFCSLGYARVKPLAKTDASTDSAALSENYQKHKKHKHHHKRHKHRRVSGSALQKNPNLYDCLYTEAGYTNTVFKDNYFHGGTVNFGYQIGCNHITFSGAIGFDFATNPSYVRTDSLPLPTALHNYVFLNETFTIGVPIGDHYKIEFPLKTNLVLGKHAPAIPAFINNYRFDEFAAGADFLIRLNPRLSDFNVWLGVGSTYRFAYDVQTSNITSHIGKNEDYSGLSYYAFLRFDFK